MSSINALGRLILTDKALLSLDFIILIVIIDMIWTVLVSDLAATSSAFKILVRLSVGLKGLAVPFSLYPCRPSATRTPSRRYRHRRSAPGKGLSLSASRLIGHSVLTVLLWDTKQVCSDMFYVLCSLCSRYAKTFLNSGPVDML